MIFSVYVLPAGRSRLGWPAAPRFLYLCWEREEQIMSRGEEEMEEMQYSALHSCTYFSLSLEADIVLTEVAVEDSVSLRVKTVALNTAQTLPITIPLLFFLFFWFY